MTHAHPCPECYRPVPCDDDCDRVSTSGPSEPTRYPHVVCTDCAGTSVLRALAPSSNGGWHHLGHVIRVTGRPEAECLAALRELVRAGRAELASDGWCMEREIWRVRP